MHVLIAGVGYQNMRDLSVGPDVIPELSEQPWKVDVEAIHLHFGPIHVVQWLEERPGYFDRMVFIAAVQRGRGAGQIDCYHWAQATPDPEVLQQRIGEAVMGVIDLDNLLIIAQHFRVLAPEVVVVEVEPVDIEWGNGYSPPVAASITQLLATVQQVTEHGYHG
ncbi:MAG: hypothetical protein NVS2B7_31790 [Herpetosiphon sp.]